MTRNFLHLADLPGGELAALLDAAARGKRGDYDRAAAAGKRVALLFFNPSLRTRMSMELAAQSIGAHTVAVVPGADAWKLETKRGAVMDGDTQEHLVDAVRVMAEMSDLIAVRTFAGLKDADDDRREPVLTEVARESKVPVVNMESAFDHPLQALADLLTMQEEFGRDLRGVPVTLTWAPHPRTLPMAVPAAFLRGVARMGMDIRVAAPSDFALPQWLRDEATADLAPGGSIRYFEDQQEAIRGCRAVYAKAWGSPLFYADPDAGLAARRRHWNWTVTEKTMSLGDRAIFLHCLPVRRNVVVTDEVLDGARSRAYVEAGNRLHTARAVLVRALGGSPR